MPRLSRFSRNKTSATYPFIFKLFLGQISIVNKTLIGFRTGSDSGLDRIGLVSSLLVQNFYFKKSCSNRHRWFGFYLRAVCVTIKKNRF